MPGEDHPTIQPAASSCSYFYTQIVADAPWEISDAFLDRHKIDFVAHDEVPYGSDDSDDLYAHLKRRGMFVATKRTEGVSTSDIVARIVKDYDVYVRRNLARGYSAKELNVSFLKEKKFRFQNKMDELKDKGKRVMSEVKGDIITKWEEKSRDFIDAFLLLFGREGLTNMWDKSKGRIMQALSPAGSPTHSRDGSVNGDMFDTDDEEDDDDDDEEEADRNGVADGADDDDDEDYYIGVDGPTTTTAAAGGKSSIAVAASSSRSNTSNTNSCKSSSSSSSGHSTVDKTMKAALTTAPVTSSSVVAAPDVLENGRHNF